MRASVGASLQPAAGAFGVQRGAAALEGSPEDPLGLILDFSRQDGMQF